MGNCLKIFALVLGLSLAVGCASPKNSSPVVEKSETQRLLETRMQLRTPIRQLPATNLLKELTQLSVLHTSLVAPILEALIALAW